MPNVILIVRVPEGILRPEIFADQAQSIGFSGVANSSLITIAKVACIGTDSCNVRKKTLGTHGAQEEKIGWGKACQTLIGNEGKGDFQQAAS